MEYYLAIDIGASSGRGIVGWLDDGQLITDEVYRFYNGVKEEDGHLLWDVNYLFQQVKQCIKQALAKYQICSLSIDTWGVDYVLMKGDEEVLPVYAYRDSRTERVIEQVHSIIPFEQLYQHTGCQFQPFNTMYQLYDDLKQGRLEGVTDYLMMPEYLLYKLTGVKMNEFTNATTTGMINHQTLQIDEYIVDKLGLPKNLFKGLSQPGAVMGNLKREIVEEVGGDCQVILCATHDTGSAVEGIPMEGDNLYISSGTWSLLGVKTEKPLTDEGSMKANYSNEGGVGYNRYQKNIMGLWLVNELKREICPDTDFNEIVKLAMESNYEELVDGNDSKFLAPASMKAVFDQSLENKPQSIGDYFRCAYRSLALCYRKAIEELENNTGKQYEKLYIVGGGAKNEFLNNLTRQFTGKEVIALPIEATALGNLKIQMEVK